MKVQENAGVVVVMIALAVMSRLLPHYPNFTAVGAVALFGGAYLSRRLAFVVPFVALFISDLVLNNVIYAVQFPEFYNGFTLFHPSMIPGYIAFVLVILFAMRLFTKVNAPRVLGGAVGAALIFFLVSNFGVFLTSASYPKTFAGLILCYEAGLPFFWNSLAGNALFSVLLFGVYEFILSRQKNRATSTI